MNWSEIKDCYKYKQSEGKGVHYNLRNLPVTAFQQANSPPKEQLDPNFPQCLLKWRQGQLLVKLSNQVKHLQLPAFECNQWLVKCLQNSSVRLIRIDPDLGEAKLMLWVDACEQSKKPAFLKIPAIHTLPRQYSPVFWRLKRLMDWSAAAILLLVLSPVMLGIILLIRVYLPRSSIFFQEWHVGERGKLFRLLKFRTMVVDLENLQYNDLHAGEYASWFTLLHHWIRKYRLDHLPQLFNVLQGEMSLVGPRPWALYNAVGFSLEGQRRLNALPGIIGVYQVQTRATLLDLDTLVTNCELKYLYNWSLGHDLKIILMTITGIFTSFGDRKKFTTN